MNLNGGVRTLRFRRGRMSPRDWREFHKLLDALAGGGFAQRLYFGKEDAALTLTAGGSEMLYYLSRLQHDLERTPGVPRQPLGKTQAKQLFDLAMARLPYEVL